MNLTEHYKELYKTSIRKIEKGDHKIDSLIDSQKDERFGISLLIRPPEIIKNRIQLFLDKLKQIDPSQYYYPNTDIHITILSIISCYEGFQLDHISIPHYIDLTEKNLMGISKFSIDFQGITASESGLMIQGYPEDETLTNLRNNLRINFKNSPLEQSIDKRYSIQTAHSTIVRFRNKLESCKEFLDVIENYRNYDFGKFEVNKLELVFNDWYLRKENSEVIAQFDLPSNP